ncbi:hypothetical protein PAESOLCIP111_01199 [Paenibacillus solanacearum]|uniref:Uncharacterized protein n=1 Tax=Paenibacillus solanacearum TaxID=2048548 RepID=A0A916JY27_9BACL|nr:hypothetical protein [Paenibacillus solanacearum]CAG7609717.1 hypothetical protein PAESOLCIP111_01199 [Paenibacillus solanacearum]
MAVYYITIALIGVISVIATLMIANSVENKTESDRYTKQTKGNIMRLSYLNIVSLVIWAVIMIIYLAY